MRLLINRDSRQYAPYYDPVSEAEGVFLQDPRLSAASPNPGYLSLLPGRALYRLAWYRRARPLIAQSAHLNLASSQLAVLIGSDYSRCLPQFLLSPRNALYVFDTWPGADATLIQFSSLLRVGQVFVASSQAAERLSRLDTTKEYHWVPTGIDPSRYWAAPASLKNIDVFQLGRKHDRYHSALLRGLDTRYIYLHEASPGDIVFQSRQGFVDGLARARISICFPMNITHPQRAGGQSTMTPRFLQSMVSRCLLVGESPPEMRQLFGYDPVVPASYSDPASQIHELLRKYASYKPLIERNYEAVLRAHTWRHRWLDMSSYIFAA